MGIEKVLVSCPRPPRASRMKTTIPEVQRTSKLHAILEGEEAME